MVRITEKEEFKTLDDMTDEEFYEYLKEKIIKEMNKK